MKIGELIHFHDERFFEGAVQLRWVETQEAKARQAAQAFVFHGPRYHGASVAEDDGIEGSYRIKDSASFVRDLLDSIQTGWRGGEDNPYWMVVAGYGSGKSHLALTCAALLGKLEGVTEPVLEHIEQADAALGTEVRAQIAQLVKPVLVLPLDGMAGFHLGNALSQAVFAQLRRHGVDASAIRELSPRFQTAEQFVERNFEFRADSFARQLPPGLAASEICARLRDNDEAVYAAVDAIYTDANGSPIPVVGQESAQDLINTLCEVYCGPEGAFSSVLILFDEFGRYLEYAADKPRLAGDAALQQIFQGVQDNSGKIRFVGFLQYELKLYLNRFGGADLRQLQRYITRFDAARKWYLSTNLETIFAHMIGKNEAELASLWRQAQAETEWQTSWRYLSQSLPGFHRLPVWSDFEQFSRVIGQGCWPLHPLATWFLTRQSDVVQSRSALTFIKDAIERAATEDALAKDRLRQISAAELVLSSLLPELIAAERATGATTAETLHMLLEKFQAHLTTEQQRVLAGVAILAKMRVGKQTQDAMNRLVGEAAALEPEAVNAALGILGQELGALEWNGDLGQYELIADAASRGQFQQWLRKKLTGISPDVARDLFIRRGAKDSGLGNIDSDFGHNRDIRTAEWQFAAQFAHVHTLENAIQRAFHEWAEAIEPTHAKGRVIYLYLHADDDLQAVATRLQASLQAGLDRAGQARAPIWVIGLVDRHGILAEHIGRLEIFDDSVPDDLERFRRFIPEERQRSQLAVQEAVQAAIKEHVFWIAGLSEPPQGRLKAVAEAIFASVYPQALPFPFDGFASGPGGPADAAQLMRHLVTGQVNGDWLQTQPVRLRNRVQTVLARSWQALRPDGRLLAPQEPKVAAVHAWLQHTHQTQPSQTLWASYRALLAPPYGMNASSAGLLLGVLLGGVNPPRRIAQNGVMVASSDWVAAAFPAQRHYLKREQLENTTVRFLAEDAESRWRNLLERWDSEENYQTQVEIAQEAEQLRRADPLPESLEGRYLYLRDQAEAAGQSLRQARAERDSWEHGIEKAECHNDVGRLLKFGSLLTKQRREMDDNPCWPRTEVEACDALLAPLRAMVGERVTEWIHRQGCNSVAQISDFRHRMDKAVSSLKDLGYTREADELEKQAQRAIAKAEARQKFSLTLDESDNYPHQPEPTESTQVRTLRDAMTQGDRLIEGIRAAATVLSGAEITARIDAVQRRQACLKAMLDRHCQALGNLYAAPLTSTTALEEVLFKAKRLREIFVETPDEREISDMVAQLERVQVDIGSWEIGDSTPERLTELLQQHLRYQVQALGDFLAAREIEPAWDLEAIYHAIAGERIDAQRRRSAEWLLPRQALVEQLHTLDLNQCTAFELELKAAPAYLAVEDRAQVEMLLTALHSRRAELIEQARRVQFAEWQARFVSLGAVEALDRYETEQLLQELRSPPVTLLPEELASMQPILLKLISRFDQISLDEIIERIERLPETQQRRLFCILLENRRAKGATNTRQNPGP